MKMKMNKWKEEPEVYSVIISDAEFFDVLWYLLTAVEVPTSGSGQ